MIHDITDLEDALYRRGKVEAKVVAIKPASALNLQLFQEPLAKPTLETDELKYWTLQAVSSFTTELGR